MTTKTDKSAQIIALVCFVALGTPFLFGYGAIPLTNFAGEIVSTVGFAMLLVLANFYRKAERLGGAFNLLHLLFLLLALAVVAQYIYFGQNNAVAWLILMGYVALGGIATWVGYVACSNGYAGSWLKGITFGLLLACSLASVASFIQYFALDGSLLVISPAAQAGRTFGFIRQPNHQATFLCLGLVSLITLQRLAKPNVAATALVLLGPILAFGVVSTGSRTALVELVFVSMFALFFLRKEKRGHIKALYPIVCVVVTWLSLYYLNQLGGAEFYGSSKLEQTNTEGAGVRAEVWRQTWIMIVERPWFGAGLPYYSAAFYLSGAAATAGIIMTHSHNLFLQLAFGLGLPLTLVFFALLAIVLYRARKQAGAVGGFFAFSLIGCILIHSQVEFPLWYTYFLLPFCFCVGWLCSASLQPSIETPTKSLSPQTAPGSASLNWTQKAALGIGAAVLGLAAWMNHDFYKVTPLFSAAALTQLTANEQEAKQTFWFRHFVQFALLSREKMTQSNHQDYLRRVSKLGCYTPEFWYQPNTIVALTFAGRLDEAKWILYSYAVLARGNVEHFKAALKEASPPLGDDMLAYLASPQPVPRAIQTFDVACYSSQRR